MHDIDECIILKFLIICISFDALSMNIPNLNYNIIQIPEFFKHFSHYHYVRWKFSVFSFIYCRNDNNSLEMSKDTDGSSWCFEFCACNVDLVYPIMVI